MMINGVPEVGFRFDPNDHDLIRLLVKKVRKEPILKINSNDIREDEDLYEKEPWSLYEDLNISKEEGIKNKHYFFTPVKNKFGAIMERTVGCGQWTIQRKLEVLDSSRRYVIGWKKILNFQVNRENMNPSWIMHEYTLLNSDDDQDKCMAVCRIGRKLETKKPIRDKVNLVEPRTRNKKRRRTSEPVHQHMSHQPFSICEPTQTSCSSSQTQQPFSMAYSNSVFSEQNLHRQSLQSQLQSNQHISQQPFSFCEPSSSGSSSHSQQPFSVAYSNSAFKKQNLHHQSLQSQFQSDPTTSNSKFLEAIDGSANDQGLGDDVFGIQEFEAFLNQMPDQEEGFFAEVYVSN